MAELVCPYTVLPHGEGLEPPGYETAGAAGMDVRAAVPANAPEALEPGERKAIPTGLKFAVPNGFEMQVRPRSGLAIKKGLTAINTPGTVDSDYRGEVMVLLVNHGQERVEITRGMRIAQLLFAPVTLARLEPRETLDETERGEGGFGSTGNGAAKD